jgi:DNA-binding protein H-NS
MATLKSLKTKIAQLQEQAKVIAQKESASVIAKIHALMDDHEITMEALAASRRGKSRSANSSASVDGPVKSAAIARYRDPKSGATWSGHGRAPGWIASAKSRDRFLVDGSDSIAAPAKKTARAGNYPRGPQPAKYRDPASGAEWSGRGKAPNWLATAKDRTAFLIDAPVKSSEKDSGADLALATGNPSAKKAAKKVASKKAAAKKGASAVKDAAAKETTAKATAKKAATRNTAAKKSAAKKVSAKSAAIGSPAKKATAGAHAKKMSTKKVAAKKIAAKKVPTATASEAPAQASEVTTENIVS